jgi:hypothetical protein
MLSFWRRFSSDDQQLELMMMLEPKVIMFDSDDDDVRSYIDILLVLHLYLSHSVAAIVNSK